MHYTTDMAPTFETFYVRYVKLVRHVFTRNYASYHEQLDDLTQETFVRAWKAYERLDHAQNVRAWICHIARNVACDYARSIGRHEKRTCSLEEKDGMVHDIPDVSQDERMACIEASDSIRDAYQRLCSEDQRVMGLLFAEYTPREIAAVLKLESEACHVRIRRARRRFQRFYTHA
ncbi:MAG TPA: RNA polymerase sigma factor [Ktedonobacteraceae bacterium]